MDADAELLKKGLAGLAFRAGEVPPPPPMSRNVNVAKGSAAVEGVAVDLDEAWRLMNLALAAAQANGDPGGYTSDIHAALPRIKSKQGGGNVAMVMTGPDGTVRTF